MADWLRKPACAAESAGEDFRVADIRGDALELHLDDSPPRHGNLIGWPAERHEQLALARELATVARAVPAPGA